MATGIVRAWTQDGFIIAADGLEVNHETKQPYRDDKQKIFQLGSSKAAYSATGAVGLGCEGVDDESVLWTCPQF
jgi:hypothetical protein